jgi:predicted AAA+ superfamily ATPase
LTAVSEDELRSIAERLDALTRLIARAVPAEPAKPDFGAADAFVWHPATHVLQPVAEVSRVDISLVMGIVRM